MDRTSRPSRVLRRPATRDARTLEALPTQESLTFIDLEDVEEMANHFERRVSALSGWRRREVDRSAAV